MARLGLITQSSILSLPSYTELRHSLVADSSLICAVELGTGVFPLQSGEKVNSVLLVAQCGPKDATAALTEFRNLTGSPDKAVALKQISQSQAASDKHKVYLRDSAAFLRLPNVSLSISHTLLSVRYFEELPAAVRHRRCPSGVGDH